MTRTHIRRPTSPFARYCNGTTGSSISFHHFAQRESSIVIAAHIRSLPEPLCDACSTMATKDHKWSQFIYDTFKMERQ